MVYQSAYVVRAIPPSPGATQHDVPLVLERESSPSPNIEEVWGPLAVIDDDAVQDLDAGTSPGRLIIGPDCVTLRVSKDTRLTLIWRDAETTWDPLLGQILFDDREEGLITLSDGDRIRLGGASLLPPDSPDQGAAQPTWIVPPDASCPQERWVVHQVDILERADR